jgi:hypothetical protein
MPVSSEQGGVAMTVKDGIWLARWLDLDRHLHQPHAPTRGAVKEVGMTVHEKRCGCRYTRFAGQEDINSPCADHRDEAWALRT